MDLALAAAILVAQPPSLESRVAKLEAEVATIKWQQVEFGKRLDNFQSGTAAKTPVSPPVKESLTTQTVCTPEGCFQVPVQAAATMQFQTQAFASDSCAGGSCGAAAGGGAFRRMGRGLFGRRHK